MEPPVGDRTSINVVPVHYFFVSFADKCRKYVVFFFLFYKLHIIANRLKTDPKSSKPLPVHFFFSFNSNFYGFFTKIFNFLTCMLRFIELLIVLCQITCLHALIALNFNWHVLFACLEYILISILILAFWFICLCSCNNYKHVLQ